MTPAAKKLAKATFARLLNGRWGLRVEGIARAGQKVLAERRSGSAQEKTISKVLGYSRDGQFSYCSMKKDEYTPEPEEDLSAKMTAASPPMLPAGHTCPHCGMLSIS